jgi:riboflavin kinase/FMN adenylyltransferase
MEYIVGLENLPKDLPPHVVTEGAFDGVHCGHQALLKTALEVARETGVQTAVLTFEPTPAEIFRRLSRGDLRLTVAEERREALEALDVGLVVVAEFNQALRTLEPEQFVRRILVGGLNARTVVASETHTFGHRQGGNIYTLTRLGCELGFEVRVLPLTGEAGLSISSTSIRELLWEGRVEEANRLLCREYSCFGEVVAGDGRGRELGYPTANVQVPRPKLLPAEGVYAGWAAVRGDPGQRWPAALALGSPPTFDLPPDARRLEAHLLGFQEDLLGRELVVAFTRRLREQRTFANREELVRQIAQEVQQVAANYGAASVQSGPGWHSL